MTRAAARVKSLVLFKEIIFPYLIYQTTRISLYNQLWNISKVMIIF